MFIHIHFAASAFPNTITNESNVALINSIVSPVVQFSKKKQKRRISCKISFTGAPRGARAVYTNKCWYLFRGMPAALYGYFRQIFPPKIMPKRAPRKNLNLSLRLETVLSRKMSIFYDWRRLWATLTVGPLLKREIIVPYLYFRLYQLD